MKTKIEQLCNLIINNPGVYGIFSRPSFGKTTFLMQLTDEILKRKEGKAFVLSLEMSKEQLVKKAKLINLDYNKLIILEDDLEDQYIEELEFALHENEKPTLIVVDYFQLLVSFTKYENFLKLKELSKVYSIPLLITGGLSRRAQYRELGRPELEDLPHPANIDDFDTVIFLHRDNNESCCIFEGDHSKEFRENRTELIFVKNVFEHLDNIFIELTPKEIKFIY